jgi:hypothetical protein
LIVQNHQLADRLGRHLLEKATQGRRVWKSRQAQQGKKGTVVLQDLGFVDASQSSHNRVQQSQDQIGMKVIGIATQPPNGSLQATTESQLVAKTLQQYHPTEVG